jgi:hypothetical protein
MPDAEHRAPDAVRAKETQLVRDERLAVHFKQRLWDFLGQRPQAR